MMRQKEADERGLGCFRAYMLCSIPMTAFWLLIIFIVCEVTGWIE